MTYPCSTDCFNAARFDDSRHRRELRRVTILNLPR